MKTRLLPALLSLPAILAAGPALAAAPALLAHQAPLELNEASAAWILTSTALVLLMTLPGLALFYGGMVRRKNVLATIAHSTAAMAIVTVLWFIAGYSLSFGSSGEATNGFIGGLQAAFLNGVTPTTAHSLAPGLPEFLWIAYQLTFAIITPALIAGAFAERIKFSASILFFFLWHLIVYAPICHQVWGGGWMGSLGVLDFAGGAVVHVNAGVAGLVAALVLGPRHGHGRDNMAPHNLAYTAIGAGLLLVGWLGFNAGSAWAADGIAAVAAFNTLLAAAAAALAWTAVEWFDHKKPTLLGLLSGLVAGLVGITPAAGLVDPKGAFIIGLVCGPACYAGAVWLKRALKYDDSLDAFGVHGVGGIVGALLTGVLATAAINPAAAGANLLNQAIGLVAVIAWSAIGTFLILMICKFTTGLRVPKEEEIEGLDYTQHGETVHS
ncbi:MAG: ammonium transporter [Alphaproteobacteria bacterium]|jgi:ammonium transporter, Amt family|nr:ammonium transporter [Alphaproteobacteria bacterium]MBU2040767.1 ammonium transporter [Alphaproteobacteria bacterium]MBU2207877.1 ammonium transporter [Alphaproteobacteria bacterium]MBU2291240.1 ammonium transporter [Alphaproteobacteria bacterium]MBU2396674.1 ammonium transporter [Alphaproteobacteria bacterium]